MRQAIVRRKGRRLVGVTVAHYSRVVKLRRTSSGDLPVTAVVARALEIGLSSMEEARESRKK